MCQAFAKNSCPLSWWVFATLHPKRSLKKGEWNDGHHPMMAPRTRELVRHILRKPIWKGRIATRDGICLKLAKKTACSAPPLPLQRYDILVYSFGTSPRPFVLALVAISIHHRVKVLLWYVAEAWWHWSSSWCTCNLWGREGNGTYLEDHPS